VFVKTQDNFHWHAQVEAPEKWCGLYPHIIEWNHDICFSCP
jgi:hypothetical protein